MTRALFAAAVTGLFALPAFAQEEGGVLTNNPNELPRFFQKDASDPADWTSRRRRRRFRAAGKIACETE